MRNFSLPQEQSTSVKMNNNQNAILFLFMPKEIPDHTLRPLSYNFNQTLVASIHDTIKNQTPINSLLNSTAANVSIIPSSKGIPVNTSILSSCWSFLMIVDSDAQNSGLIDIDNLPPARFRNMRFIYSGYCIDEPVLPQSMNLSKPVINQQSKLIITRKVIINKLNYKINNTGTHMKEDVLGDILVAKYDNRLIAGSLYSLVPGNAMDAIEPGATTDNNNTAMFSTVQADESLEVQDAIKISSNFQSPKNHLKTIVNSIHDGIEDMVMSENVGSFKDMSSYASSDDGYNNDVIYNNIRSNLAYSSDIENIENNELFGINSEHNLFLQNVKNMYNPEIYIIKNQQNRQMSIIPQSYVSLETVFSSLISSCVPSYAINTKLSSVSFWYDSHNDISEPYHFDSTIACSQPELLNKWNSFIYLFKKELVPILRDNGGEFNVLINCTTNASTYVKLAFYDNGKVFGDDDYYEHSNIPGGLCTNMLGSVNTLSKNGSMLHSLSANVSEMSLLDSNVW